MTGTTTIANARLKKVQKKLAELEGAVGLLAQRLHNAETMLCKATSMVISVAPAQEMAAMQAELMEYFQCSDSLGAFEEQVYYTGDADDVTQEDDGDEN